ncbi:MAG: hypothetical protein QXG86_00355 [Candidatus Woesearchaeota archaeon]
MRKKAVQVSLLTLIILIVVFIIILVLTNKINFYLKKTNIREYCRLSVEAEQAAKIGGKETIFNLDCPMQYIYIKNSELPKEDDKIKNYISRKIADAMYDCWYKMGKGKYYDFTNKFIGADDQACLLCSIIYFEKKGLTIENMKDWLDKNIPTGAQFSYSDFLSFNEEKRYYFEEPISTSSNYYVVFVAIVDSPNLKFPDEMKKYFNIPSMSIGGTPFSAVVLVKDKEIEKLGCEMLLN